MRHISFFLTQPQILAKTKTVTRRSGWGWASPGLLLQPIRKGQGLKAGETVERLGSPIRLVSVRAERLTALVDDPAYGAAEAALEGFPDWTGQQFVDFICRQPGIYPNSILQRLQFEYTAAQ